MSMLLIATVKFLLGTAKKTMREIVFVFVCNCQRNFSKDDVQLPLVSGDNLLFTPLVLGVQCP